MLSVGTKNRLPTKQTALIFSSFIDSPFSLRIVFPIILILPQSQKKENTFGRITTKNGRISIFYVYHSDNTSIISLALLIWYINHKPEKRTVIIYCTGSSILFYRSLYILNSDSMLFNIICLRSQKLII